MSKPWYQSKTIWINVIAGILEIIAIAGTFPGADAIAMWLPPATAVLNIIMRRLTSVPIEGSPAAEREWR